jgi:hypothetical protein
MTEPAESRAVECILNADTPHELALLGDAGWVGAEAGRMRFSQELARRIAAARDLGRSLQMLALRDVALPREHYDLLVKHQVSVVRQSRAGASLASLQPQALRHGVWESPPVVELPRQGHWFGKGALAARRAIHKAAALRGMAHVVFDLAAFEKHDFYLQAAENVLRTVARSCGRGVLRAATVRRLAAEWPRLPTTTPARSILRAA